MGGGLRPRQAAASRRGLKVAKALEIDLVC
jgi:hypothetical protein